jgi:hypothetical protein
MSKADQFWQYAREAVLAACDAKITDDKQGLFDLACAWTQAAFARACVLGRSGQPGQNQRRVKGAGRQLVSRRHPAARGAHF